MNKNMLKSIGAVLAGFLTVVILSTVTDAILHSAGVYPEGGYLSNAHSVLATVYRTIFTVLGGYVTVRLAPNKPMRHVMILAILGTLGGLLGLISTWDKNLGPVWYPIALTVLAYPSVWFGGTLYKSQKTLN